MLQSFDPTAAADGAIATRLSRLRARFDDLGIDGLVIPRADEYQGEYVPPSAERLRFATGFSGSAGMALVLEDSAVLFVDGRYTLQAASETDPTLLSIVDTGKCRPSAWIADHLPAGARVGIDPALHGRAEYRRLKAAVEKAGGSVVDVAPNPVDAIWDDRPPAPSEAVVVHPVEVAGRDVPEKLADVVAALADKGADAALVAAPDGVAWLFNIRGRDIPRTPVALARAIVPARDRPRLFVRQDRLDEAVRSHLSAHADLYAPEAIDGALAELGRAGRKVLCDTAVASERLLAAVEAAGGTVVDGRDPVVDLKAIKNPVEIEGMRAAHRRDGIAVARFLAWLDRSAPNRLIDEIAVVRALEAFREETGALKDISFDTIAGAGPNGAIVHYRVNRDTSRILVEGEPLLVDSGAQYQDGTTDVTRTVAIGVVPHEVRRHFTLVLKGHIAIASARFPRGTTGAQLDALARMHLWRAGLDFDHGTGHGVGAYLSVHEGPQRLSKLGHDALKPGMILSNEPGSYVTGKFGIRIENLVLVSEADVPVGGDRPMLGFETLTLVPIDRRLVLPELMTAGEIAWLDGYHARVHGALVDGVDAATREWLARATLPFG